MKTEKGKSCSIRTAPDGPFLVSMGQRGQGKQACSSLGQGTQPVTVL